MKWYYRKKREYVESVAVDIFGPKTDMKEHFRRCRPRYNGYPCYIQSLNLMGCDAHEAFNSFPRGGKGNWRMIDRAKNELIAQEKEETKTTKYTGSFPASRRIMGKRCNDPSAPLLHHAVWKAPAPTTTPSRKGNFAIISFRRFPGKF